MVTCPRCGNDADYLGDDPFILIHCEFCCDDIDVTDLSSAVTSSAGSREGGQQTCAPVM